MRTGFMGTVLLFKLESLRFLESAAVCLAHGLVKGGGLAGGSRPES